MKSMTGYGNATELRGGREITAEIRSVNNRYLNCSVKLPRAYSFVEEAAKQLIKKHISRGKVDVYITVISREGTEVEISVNRPVLEGYLTALRSIAKEYDLRDDVTVGSLARMPDVFLVDKANPDEEQIQKDILAVLEAALNRYIIGFSSNLRVTLSLNCLNAPISSGLFKESRFFITKPAFLPFISAFIIS